MRIYLDNNATTPIHPAVLETLDRTLRSSWGNASSIHEEGQRARRELEQARESVAALIHCEPRELVFTSGGTESNNAAIHGSVVASFPSQAGYNIVTSAIEHPSVLEPLRDLEARGCSVTRVAPGRDGAISARAMIDAICPDTRLVCLMLANNETGVLQPVAEVAAACRERGIHMHCDAVQGGGKVEVDVRRLDCDTLSLSGHKMHGPKGIGALFVRPGTTLHPHLAGGAQERRRRAGTENVPQAVAFGVASAIAWQETSVWSEIALLRDRLETELRLLIPGLVIHGEGTTRLPNTSNLRFPGVDAEGLVIALDLQGVAVSTGSACSSGRVEPSHVLLQMGLSEEDAKSSVRISLSRFTAAAEIDRLIELLGELVPKTRRDAAIRAS
ncbi:MAG TPA: cysteine desulfurase family protein [Thermoanaerobaculia bacterium]|nr:cysteine desulfurase family protein [Thermoanaerobaculia bacterium]